MKKICLIILSCLIWTFPLRAEPTLTLKDVLSAAQRNNPEIKAARKKWEAAKTRIVQEWTPEKPRLDLERMYAPRDKDIISNAEEKNVVVSQEIPFPTTLYLRGKKAAQEARIAEAAYHAKERDVIARVKKAYAMYAQSHHHARIVQENVELMKRFSRIAESKYSVGKASQADVLKAQVELARMLNMLVDMEQEKEVSQAMLNTLLNKNPEDPLGMPNMTLPSQLSQKVESLQAAALEASPQLNEAAWNAKASRSSLAIARADYLPDIMLQYRQRNMEMQPDTQDAMIGLSIPLWFWKQGAMVNEAKAELEMNQAELESMRNMTRFEVKNLLTQFQTAMRLVQLYETSVIPQAKQSLRVTEAAYQADKADFLDLLEASRTLASFHQDYYHYLTQSEVVLAELERVVGVDLEPHDSEENNEHQSHQ